MGPLKKHQTFADLGHGVGNACLQASYTVGCKSKGIELIDARYFVSEAFHRAMDVATLEARSRDVSASSHRWLAHSLVSLSYTFTFLSAVSRTLSLRW